MTSDGDYRRLTDLTPTIASEFPIRDNCPKATDNCRTITLVHRSLQSEDKLVCAVI